MNTPASPRHTAIGHDQREAARLAVLRVLERNPAISQRDLSLELGLSLGKTHYLLHALLDKGWVKTRNFRRSDNKLAYAYLLTASGLKEKVSLTRRFLARKEIEFEALTHTIGELRTELHHHDSARPSDGGESAQRDPSR
jgi:EPS-associated MarR family transcriptional regulator